MNLEFPGEKPSPLKVFRVCEICPKIYLLTLLKIVGHLHTINSQSSNIYCISHVCKTLKGKEGEGKALTMEEFSNQVREMGRKG